MLALMRLKSCTLDISTRLKLRRGFESGDPGFRATFGAVAWAQRRFLGRFSRPGPLKRSI